MKPYFVGLLVITALASVLTPISATRDFVYVQERTNQISPEAARGFSLYQSGDTQAALNVLRERVRSQTDDPDAWHYLGLISMKVGDFKLAVESFRKAIDLRPHYLASHTGLSYSLLLNHKYDDAKVEADQLLKLNRRSDEAHYILAAVFLQKGDYRKSLDEADTALEIEPRFNSALEVKDRALFSVFMRAAYPFLASDQEAARRAVGLLQILGGCCLDMNAPNLQPGKEKQAKRLAEAADIYESSIKRTPKLPMALAWQEDLESLIFWRGFFDPYDGKSLSKVVDARSVTTKAKILSRPKPQFSHQDVKDLQQANVVLAFVITESGEVKHIMVIKSQGYDLTRKAVDAARNLKFEPAQKGGRPVSIVATIEYDFKKMSPTSN